MSKEKVDQKVEKLFTPLLKNLGYEIVAVEYVKEGREWYLRFFIDKPKGITIDDCELVSRKIEEVLDASDVIQGSYILEVSSPGIERPLKKDEDFLKYQGELVQINTFKPLDGQKIFKGQLKASSAEEICLLVGNREIKIPRTAVSNAHLAVDI